MFFADTGTAVIWLARHINGGKNRRLFGSFAWASMANAAPNAFGAQLAYPGRQTIALCGDGGFTMLGVGDLLTQVERKTPMIHILLNNGSLDFVNIEQQEAGYIPYGVGFKNPNFAAVAEAMGAKGIRIEEPDAVREGLTEALAHKIGPVIVDVVSIPMRSPCPARTSSHDERVHAQRCQTGPGRQDGRPHKDDGTQCQAGLDEHQYPLSGVDLSEQAEADDVSGVFDSRRVTRMLFSTASRSTSCGSFCSRLSNCRCVASNISSAPRLRRTRSFTDSGTWSRLPSSSVKYFFPCSCCLLYSAPTSISNPLILFFIRTACATITFR
jgi:hypothetical protein